jgi:hypothetical protein
LGKLASRLWEARMAKQLSRMELYALVWAEPMKTLSLKFGISDVALKKTCARAEIPTPDRGYWAKKEAGKSTLKDALPARPPFVVPSAGIAPHGISNPFRKRTPIVYCTVY